MSDFILATLPIAVHHCDYTRPPARFLARH